MQYINDEFDWIRSGVAPDNLEDYLSADRKDGNYRLARTIDNRF